MARKQLPPKYRRQRQRGKSDRAFVEFQGKRIYLGEYGSDESRAQYARLIKEWEYGGRDLPPPSTVETSQLTVSDLLARFWVHAEKYYVDVDGKPTSELSNFRLALRPVCHLYGDRAAATEFGPRALKTVREDFIHRRCSRGYINRHVNRIKLVFRWGVEEELIPSSVYEALRAVRALKRGRSEARELPAVMPVPEAHVTAIQPHVSRQVWAMVQLQLLTGARPGEIVIMRGVDLDTSGDVWVYRPERHKNAHRGHGREIYLGPRAQSVVRAFLAEQPLTGFLFSPMVAERERLSELNGRRRTPASCGNSVGSNRRQAPRIQPGEHYSVDSYRRAIARGCKAAEVPSWSPHRLRHLAGTTIRKRFGLEVAQVVLGHKHAQVTEVYAELDKSRAIKAQRKHG